MQTGDLIKKARIEAGLTQAELAKKLGITPQVISQYERGVKNPKFETVAKIAAVLDIPAKKIYYYKGLADNPTVTVKYTTKKGRELQSKISRLTEELSEEGLEKLLEYAEFLKGKEGSVTGQATFTGKESEMK